MFARRPSQTIDRPRSSSAAGSNRIVALDGLRGVAALVVVLGHLFGALPFALATKTETWRSPLGIFLNGSAAVQVFFVLSGFVLTGSLARGSRLGLRALPGYAVRRFWRLHPPYLAAAWFAYLATSLYPDPEVTRPASIFVAKWGGIRASAEQMLALTFQLPNSAYDLLPVGWTLRVEAIFSGLMPLFVAALALRTELFLLLVAAFLALPMSWIWPSFALDFAFGILLASFPLGARAATAPIRGTAPLCFALGLIVMHLPMMLGWPWPDMSDPISLGLCSVGAAMCVAGVLYSPLLSNALSRPVCHFLGRISYSLYLVHIPIVLVVAGNLVAATTGGIVAVGALCLVLSLGVAAILERLVETPSQQVGRRFARALDERLRHAGASPP